MKLTTEQEAWLQALESGKYKQSKENLCSDEGYCCLGVACELFYKKVGLTKNILPTGIRGYYLNSKSIKVTSALPQVLIDLLYLRDPLGGLKRPYCGSYKLSDLNDNKGLSFKEIAAYIRANPENVFTKGAEDENA